uniref:Uncharacterized protein n=1 Tax=Anguilla anguilla TaxID=7936 RepID=A0A0E9P567_ANGAN
MVHRSKTGIFNRALWALVTALKTKRLLSDSCTH